MVSSSDITHRHKWYRRWQFPHRCKNLKGRLCYRWLYWFDYSCSSHTNEPKPIDGRRPSRSWKIKMLQGKYIHRIWRGEWRWWHNNGSRKTRAIRCLIENCVSVSYDAKFHLLGNGAPGFLAFEKPNSSGACQWAGGEDSSSLFLSNG